MLWPRNVHLRTTIPEYCLDPDIHLPALQWVTATTARLTVMIRSDIFILVGWWIFLKPEIQYTGAVDLKAGWKPKFLKIKYA